MQLAIREARIEDAGGVSVLLGELDYPSTDEAARCHIQRFIEDPASRLMLAESADRVVGLIATHIVPRLDSDERTCRITDIVVLASHRRRGVATHLLEAACDHAMAVGAPRLDLSSGEWRAEAHGFYLAHGFESRSRGFTKRLER
jgi:ribosomal protein S18 acetylase RimI-like enzyme